MVTEGSAPLPGTGLADSRALCPPVFTVTQTGGVTIISILQKKKLKFRVVKQLSQRIMGQAYILPSQSTSKPYSIHHNNA